MSPDFQTKKEFVYFTVAKEDLAAFMQVPTPTDFGLEAEYQDDWEYAVHYRQMVQVAMSRTKQLETVHRRAVQGILAQARRYQLQLMQAEQPRWRPWPEAPDRELDVEETLEHWHGVLPLQPDELMVGDRTRREHHVTVLADTSISMQGERFAMLNLGVALMALNLRPQHLALIAFDYDARVVKRFEQPLSPTMAVSALLQTPPQGMTDLAKALTLATSLRKRARASRHTTILLTDGAQTAGANPVDVAKGAAPLVVVPLDAHPETQAQCDRLARAGGGRMLPIHGVKDIPRRMFELARTLRQG